MVSERLEADSRKPSRKERLWALLPDVWELVRPRLALLGLGLVLMVVNRAAGLVLPASTKFLVDDVVARRRGELLLPLALTVLAATVVQGVTSFALTQSLSKGAQKLIAELRKRVQSHIGRLSLSFYDSHKSGNLVARVMADVEGIRNLIGTGLVDLLGGLLTGVLALGVLLWISPSLTLVAFLFLLCFGVAVLKVLGVIRPIFRERGKIYAEVAGRLTESLAGVRVINGYRAEYREAAVFAAGADRLLGNAVRTLTAISLMTMTSTMVLGIVGGTVMLIGGRQILAGGLSLGSFLTFTVFMGYLISPVFQIVATGTQLTEALAGLERTREILRHGPEDADPRRVVALGSVRGAVAFEGVGFAYEEGRDVLHDVTWSATPGSVTALVGPSGAGKSTVIGLIASFYTPTHGRVLVDGVDLSTVDLTSYRTQLGVVLQETFLFDGTIRENVAFGRPRASEAELLEACRVARVDEFALSFRDGYETVVGERGVKLSGGQKQRVSIARAVLADPRILILDEATSSLDSESEAMIQEGLGYLMRQRTTFVIAHRLSTIRRANQILVMEGGRIVERGSHDELYRSGGRYFELYTKQHGLVENRLVMPGEDEPPPEGKPPVKTPDGLLPRSLRLLGES